MREIHATLVAGDGHPLAATLYQPPRPLAAVQINPATGAARGYYRAYARFLAERGFAVLCYDYRGIAGSRWHAAEPQQLTMRNWGERDAAAALDWLQAQHPHLPLLAVGHSVGGQLLGLMPNNERLSGALTIAAQCGYWRHWPRRLQPLLAAVWHVGVPLAVAATGRLPAALLGVELPGGVAREWARWCRHRDFIVDARGRPLRDGFERFRGRLRMYAIADDPFYAPQAAVEALARCYRNAEVELRRIEPRQHGVAAIGHFGFFRSSMPRAAWEETADWLRAVVLSLSSPLHPRAAPCSSAARSGDGPVAAEQAYPSTA